MFQNFFFMFLLRLELLALYKLNAPRNIVPVELANVPVRHRAIALKSMLSPNCTKQSSKGVGSPHTSLIYMIISHDWNFLIVSNVTF